MCYTSMTEPGTAVLLGFKHITVSVMLRMVHHLKSTGKKSFSGPKLTTNEGLDDSKHKLIERVSLTTQAAGSYEVSHKMPIVCIYLTSVALEWHFREIGNAHLSQKGRRFPPAT